MQKLRSIQVLRAVAVTAAATSHATFWPYGAAGVDLFFVISGVIIAMVIQGRTAGEFFAARVWRIYPIYWANTFPLIVVAIVDGFVTPSRLMTSLTLWPVWGSYATPYLVPGWTLSFEMLFYSLVALGLYVGRPRLALVVLPALICLNATFSSAVLRYLGNPIVLEFIAGFLILGVPKNRLVGALALAAAAILFGIAQPSNLQSEVIMDIGKNMERVIGWGVPAALTVYGALCFEKYFGKWADIPVFLGNASYSIYLTHYLVNLTVLIWWPARVALMLATGSVCYVFIERKIMRARWQRTTAVRPALS